MPQVAPVRTPWTDRELATDYFVAWRNVVGGELSRYGIAMCIGQAKLECGHGGVSCWNFNVGNIMKGSLWQGDFHVLKNAPECYDPVRLPEGALVLEHTNIACPPGQVAAIPPGGSKFRAYPSLLAGCEDKFRMFDLRWPRAIVALSMAKGPADVDAFVAGLVGPPRYFTASSLSYANQMRSLASDVIRKMADDAWPVGESGPDTVPARPIDTERPIEIPNAADFVATLADTSDEEPQS